MYARATLLEIDTLRTTLDDAVAAFRDFVLPQLHEQPGYLGVLAMTTPEGKAMLLSFWETAGQADSAAPDGWYPAVLDEFMTMFRNPPGREHYEVAIADTSRLFADADSMS